MEETEEDSISNDQHNYDYIPNEAITRNHSGKRYINTRRLLNLQCSQNMNN